jgi:tetraacyldisaccharide 4'-kinase
LREYLYSLATDKEKGLVAGVIKLFLFALSLVYGLFLRIIIFFRRRRLYRLGCKVISVGNITLGGTGKTTLVEYIACYLKEQGYKVAILTRGYKRKDTRHKTQDTRYEEMGDEAYMLVKKLTDIPVVVGADRVKAAKKAIRDYSANALILDDGFQQWHIHKDLEIVAINAQNPFGNKRIIPRGILREPLGNLGRADIFMLTKTNFNPDIEALKLFLKSLNPSARVFESRHEPVTFFDLNQPQESIDTFGGVLLRFTQDTSKDTERKRSDTPPFRAGKDYAALSINPEANLGLQPEVIRRVDLDTLKGKNAVLFCGIGDPDSFAALISSLGINISAFFKFPDHYNYTTQDIDNITQTAKEKNIDTIITTEKDMVRVSAVRRGSSAVRFLFLRIKLEIKNEQEFHNRLLGLYSR